MSSVKKSLKMALLLALVYLAWELFGRHSLIVGAGIFLALALVLGDTKKRVAREQRTSARILENPSDGTVVFQLGESFLDKDIRFLSFAFIIVSSLLLSFAFVGCASFVLYDERALSALYEHPSYLLRLALGLAVPVAAGLLVRDIRIHKAKLEYRNKDIIWEPKSVKFVSELIHEDSPDARLSKYISKPSGYTEILFSEVISWTKVCVRDSEGASYDLYEISTTSGSVHVWCERLIGIEVQFLEKIKQSIGDRLKVDIQAIT